LTRAAVELLRGVETEPAAGGLARLVRRQRRPPTVLLGGGLVGRERLLEEMTEAARRAFAGLPTVARALGGAGAGKTHLGRELAGQLGADADVLERRAHDAAEGDVDETLRELLRAALDLPLEAPPDGGRALMAARLEEGAELWPGVALALGWARPD